MFTVCPDCQRQFRLYAEHIAAAAGQVRCGFCQSQFNALERLYDQPLSREQLATMSVPVRQPGEEPQFDIPEQQRNAVRADEAAVEVTDVEGAVSFDMAEEQSEAKDSEPDRIVETEEKEAKPQVKRAQESRDSEHASQYEFDDEQLDPEEADGDAGRRMNTWWSAGVLAVVLLLALQLGWFQRDRLLLYYPELRPYMQQLCEKLDCMVIRERDTRAIRLVNRDVRLHPTYQDTLLVNATMQNESAVRQPYPQVQLTLFDTAGSLIGYREFEPDDYLDTSIDLEKGMPVNTPVHFVLEVAGSSVEAVSFEFRFL